MADDFDPAIYDGVDLAAASLAAEAAAASGPGTGSGVSSSTAAPPPPPFYARRGYTHATWARTYASRPELWIQPASVAEVERAVRLARHRRRRITTTGCGHSPSDMTCTSSWLVNLDRMQRVLAVDRATGLVVVQAGIRLFQLSAALAEHGLALPNLGSINEQSLAGACATGTHGSSLRHGLLSDDIVALKITLADGRTRTCERPGSGEGDADKASADADFFRAALLSLGALGIVVEITLRAVPAFRLRWTQTVDTDRKMLAAWQADDDASVFPLWQQAHFVRVWWFPYTRRAVVWAADDCTESPAEAPDFTPATGYYDGRLGYLVYHNLLLLAHHVPRILPWVEWFVFGMQYGFRNGTTSAGLQVSDRALLLNCLYSQFVNEWAIPLARGPEVLRRLGAWLNRLSPGDPDYVDHGIPFSAEGLYVHAPVEVRVADTSSACSSSSSARPLLDPTADGQPTLYLNATMYRPYLKDPPGTKRYYEAFEWLMRDVGGKPHWAKAFDASHADLAAWYGSRMQRFCAVREAVDPDGLFVGPWHRRYLLGDDDSSAPPLLFEEREISRRKERDNSICITGALVPNKSGGGS